MTELLPVTTGAIQRLLHFHITYFLVTDWVTEHPTATRPAARGHKHHVMKAISFQMKSARFLVVNRTLNIRLQTLKEQPNKLPSL